jgi:3-oxoadipate CoA-transferase alpha subunit
MALTGPDSKVAASVLDAVTGIEDGMVLHVGGWGGIGVPDALISAIAATEVRGLTIITNNCGMGVPGDVGELFHAGCVSRVLATYPVHAAALAFRARFAAGDVELQLVPQGTLAERLRAAGAGLGGFYTPTAVDTPLGEGKEIRTLHGTRYVFEEPLPGDFAIVRATTADPYGNLRFRYASRGFNPLMAMAAKVTIAQVDSLVPLGALKPDDVHLPGVFVDRILVAGGEQ